MEKGYRFRIYPNKDQRILMGKTFGCARVVYNKALELQEKAYKNGEKYIKFSEMNKKLTEWKNDPDSKWLKEPDKNALQYSLKNLDRAYQNYFNPALSAKKPKYKKKKNRQKYKTAFTNNNISLLEKHIKLPKLGKVKAKIHRPIEGRIINATIELTPGGKYFCSLCCTDVELKPLREIQGEIGLDLGIKSFIVDSNGREYENKNFYRNLEEKIKKNQRILSRRKPESRRWNKQRVKVAKIHEKIKNRRQDYLHKLTFLLINENQVICIEDLNVKGLIKNHCLSKSISDCGWGEFRRILEYKAFWYCRSLSVIDRFFPSSKRCNNCGWENRGLELQDRKWTCPNCGMELDRDYNAAENVRDEGLRKIRT